MPQENCEYRTRNSKVNNHCTDWNSLIDSLVPAAEGAEDSVAKFNSLVMAGD